MSRGQNFKSYGRGKHSNHPNTVVHSSIQFDKFFCEHSNKPTAAKSAGTVGKWGITSFTSIRGANVSVGHPKETSRFSSLGKKRAPPSADNGLPVKRSILNNIGKREISPILTNRKFFKSRNTLDDPNQKAYKSSNSGESKRSGRHSRSVDENKKHKNSGFEENKPKNAPVIRTFEKPLKANSKRLAPLKIAEDPSEAISDFNSLQNLPSPPKERDKPPIVLRIFKGTSQLISETAGSKSSDSPEDDCGAAENVDLESRLADNPTNAASGATPPSEGQSVEAVAAAEPTISTRSLRRRTPEKSKSPTPEPPPIVPVKISRRHVEKAKSPSPETPPEPSARATRSLRRRSPEKVKSPEPSEPARATRSLRRRGAAAAAPAQSVPEPEPPTSPVAAPPPQTSPKRTLRSQKNMAPPPSKIVITNLKSDHPSVYINDSTTAPPVMALPSPSRKEAKETRSYSNRHKHKHANRQESSAAKNEAELQKVEQILADLSSGNGASTEAIDVPPESTAVEGTQSTKTADLSKSSADSSLDSDRAELLQLLEDDEDEDSAPLSSLAAADSAKSSALPEVTQPKEEPMVADEALPAIANSDLKIKIKISDLRKSSVEAAEVKDEPKEEPAETSGTRDAPVDSIDSGISVATDSQVSCGSAIEPTQASQKSPEHESQTLDLSKECEDRLSGLSDLAATNSDSETKAEGVGGSGTAAPAVAATNKKGSIFKHRASSNGNKKRALYKHKWVDDKDGTQSVDDDKGSQPVVDNKKALDSIFDADMDDMPLTKFIRKPTENSFDFDEPGPVTSVKCAKKNKDYYTVVRNVKKAHQIQESGEFQEFNDDVEYILDALQDNNPIGLRCLSAIKLATKCTEPAFRMHVRAHGTVTKFFRALHDATSDQSLGLCTATVMFVLSQDRLNMDLDRGSLELMLNLLESDASHTKALEDCGLTDSQLTKTRDKVRQICADIQAQGHAKHLNLDNITVGHLSMETLLSLTSKRAGEWFKEELRELGGLEHIIKTVVECCKHVDDTANAWSATSLEKIRKVDRCLRVLENITMQNEQNNCYLLEYQNGILIDTLVRMYKVCDYEIPLYPTYSIDDKDSTGAVLRECLIANLKVLINITHDYQMKSHGSNVIGSRPGVIESSLHVLLQVPQYIPKEEKFDLMLLTLILLINLVEHCETNRKAIIEAKAPSDEESIFETKAREPAVKALISMFYHYEELARNEEKKTDAILEGENAEKPPTNAPQKVHEEFIEETISQLVQKAGQNMEHTLIAAYVVMAVGYLIIDNEEFEKFVRNHLPEKNFQFMISVLQKFYSFMTLTASGGTVSNRGMKSIQMVIQQLIDSDHRHGFDVQCVSNVNATVPKSESENKNTDDADLCVSPSTSGVTVSAS